MHVSFSGPITPMKMPGGSPYSQYDMVGGEGLGDNWHRTPGNKMASKTTVATPSWPPGKRDIQDSLTIKRKLNSYLSLLTMLVLNYIRWD